MPALCHVPIGALATLTEAEPITEGITLVLTSVFLSTETVPDYVVTRITLEVTLLMQAHSIKALILWLLQNDSPFGQAAIERYCQLINF